MRDLTRAGCLLGQGPLNSATIVATEMYRGEDCLFARKRLAGA
jgi:hypothetical protein